MTVETYWLFVAPGLLLALSGFGWLALWITRRRAANGRPGAADDRISLRS